MFNFYLDAMSCIPVACLLTFEDKHFDFSKNFKSSSFTSSACHSFLQIIICFLKAFIITWCFYAMVYLLVFLCTSLSISVHLAFPNCVLCFMDDFRNKKFCTLPCEACEVQWSRQSSGICYVEICVFWGFAKLNYKHSGTFSTSQAKDTWLVGTDDDVLL